MSDRVRFATVNVTSGPGVSSGFSGFPFPVTESIAIGDGTSNPIAVTLLEAIRLHWRIKNYTVTTDLVVTDIGTPADTLPATSPFAAVRTGSTTERDLADYYLNGSSHQVIDTSNGNPGWIFFVSFSVHPDLSNSGVPYPSISIQGSILRFISPNSFDAIYINNFVGPTGFQEVTVPDGQFTCIVDGQTSFNVYWQYAPGYDATIVSLDGTFLTLAATGFWPYAALDSSPIYDTATGGQLQSPLN